MGKKIAYLLWIIFGLVLMSILVFATTNIDEDSITTITGNFTGNVTGDWFQGKTNGTQICISDFCITSWNPLNQTDLALSINTTANLQNLLNSTGIYSTYNTTYNLWAYNQTTATFNLYNDTWDESGWVNANFVKNNTSGWILNFTKIYSLDWSNVSGHSTFNQTYHNYSVANFSNKSNFWDNYDSPAGWDLDSSNDLLISDLPLENRTKSSCSNITGSISNLCTIIDTTGGNTTQEIRNAINDTIEYLFISNSTKYWDNLDTFNSTQIENSGGKLNILQSWFTSLWNTIFGTKTTDDLSEGSTNKYDNRSWNETKANTLYAPNTTAGIQYLINNTNIKFTRVNATYVDSVNATLGGWKFYTDANGNGIIEFIG